MRYELKTLAGAVVILLAGLFIYQHLLFPVDPDRIHPWGSDTWGHLVKAVYLQEQIAQGVVYPDLFPGWYNGIQMLRYHAPLPYYLLVGLSKLTPNIWWAGNLFLALSSLAGGLSFLLYRRWLGLLPAIGAGALFLAIPDNLRIAFAEGNLPRVLATALLPITFYFFLKLTVFEGKRWHFAAVVACVGLVVLSHAMMAAIFIVGCGLFAVMSGLVRAASFKSASRGILALITGAFLSGWWLLPSLTGGITEIDQQAASDALAKFPLSVSLNPFLRGENQEIYYLGISLVIGLALTAAFWKRLEPWQKALALTAAITLLISSTIISPVFNALPFHQLFWPVRFLSFAGFVTLLLLMGVAATFWRIPPSQHINVYRLGVLALLGLLVIDFLPSLQLVRGREQPSALVQFSHRLNQLDGWRVAAADLSRLGSAPSYLFAYPGEREQVFGWAFQGSVTAPLLARLNQAMVDSFDAYAVDRLSILGADDVVVLGQPDIPSSFAATLINNGFQLDRKAGELALYHRDGAPRAYSVPREILGIGRGAQNLALLFPEVMVGQSEYLDEYDQDFLNQFNQLFLAGFKWRDLAQAEERVRSFLEQGGERVVVDLTGVPNQILSRQPKFLNVYGEQVLAVEQVNLVDAGKIDSLEPFATDGKPWVTHDPQGVDEVLVRFTYPVANGTALGVKRVGEHQVHFVGLNLVFHALLTRDPAAVAFLERVFGLTSGQIPTRQIIPLIDYQAHQWGYQFNYQLDEETPALIPVAHHAGTRVYIDGQAVRSQGIDQLTYMVLPQGNHRVEIRSETIPIYHFGKLLTGIALAVTLAHVFGVLRRSNFRYFTPKREVSPDAA